MKPIKEKIVWSLLAAWMITFLFGCALIWMPTPSDVTAVQISSSAIRITWSYDIWSICDIEDVNEDALCFRVFRYGEMVGHTCEEYSGVHIDNNYPEFPPGDYCYSVQAYCRSYFGIEMGESNKSGDSCVQIDPEFQESSEY